MKMLFAIALLALAACDTGQTVFEQDQRAFQAALARYSREGDAAQAAYMRGEISWPELQARRAAAGRELDAVNDRIDASEARAERANGALQEMIAEPAPLPAAPSFRSPTQAELDGMVYTPRPMPSGIPSSDMPPSPQPVQTSGGASYPPLLPPSLAPAFPPPFGSAVPTPSPYQPYPYVDPHDTVPQ